ncbi:MAG: hypothetical protein WC342_07780 [Methanoregula sp.]
MKNVQFQIGATVFFLIALFVFFFGPAAAASPVTISLSTAEPAQGSVLVLSGTVPDNATEMQVWDLACYRVIGVMSVPANCGADVTVIPVNGTRFSYVGLPTHTQGNYSVVAAFLGQDGTFGVGYDKESRTLYYTENRTVIANWSRSNPNEREEEDVITKALGSSGIDNPYAVAGYVVTGSGSQDAHISGNEPVFTTPVTTLAKKSLTPSRPTGSESPDTTHSAATQAPGFSGIAACGMLCLTGFFLARQRRR